ncbi:MAG: alpha/beta fold hydrolase [Clostridiales bacterium]|nr:alpha/beta fold hydrolase [Clostridiales bacterium]
MDDSRVSKRFNPLAVLIGTPVVLAGGVMFLFRTASRLYDGTLRRGKNRMVELPIVTESEEQAIIKADEEFRERVRLWAETTPSTGQRLTSHDGISLYATAYTQESPDWAVVVHGYTGDGMQMTEAAKRFYEMGYNVLLPDCRGHGKSEGDYIGMGWHDRIDIINWAKRIIEWDAGSRIVLYGLSMGAAAVMMASGEDLPGNIKCLIEDCGYTSVTEEFSYHLKHNLKIPKFPILNTVDLLCGRRAGFRFREASALEQIKKCKLPILFIHGGKDYFVPTEMVYRLYQAAECEKELYIVPEAGHGVSGNVSRKPYWEKIEAFTGRCLNG